MMYTFYKDNKYLLTIKPEYEVSKEALDMFAKCLGDNVKYKATKVITND